jgi:hypothetical protein
MSDLDDQRAALEAEATEWAREQEAWSIVERLTALIIRSRDAGLSDGEIAEMLNRAYAETQADDAPDAGWTDQAVMEWMREHEASQAWKREHEAHQARMRDQDFVDLMREQMDDEPEVGGGPRPSGLEEEEDTRSAIWGGATLGLLVGLILGFFVGSSYWRTVLIAVAIGAVAGIAANVLAVVGNLMRRRGQ